jgi:hypothetical protein
MRLRSDCAQLRVLAPRVLLPALIVEPPVAFPHVRTLRGHCQESGHQKTPNEHEADCEGAEDDQHETWHTGHGGPRIGIYASPRWGRFPAR